MIMTKAKLIPAGAILGAFAIGAIVFGTSNQPVKLQTVASDTKQAAQQTNTPNGAVVSNVDPTSPTTPTETPAPTKTMSTSSTPASQPSTSAPVVNSTNEPAIQPAPVVVMGEQLVYRPNGDREDAICIYSFSDGSTQERLMGARPLGNTNAAFECSTWRG